MAYAPIDVPAPLRGVHQGSGYESPPPLTTPLARNVRPRDWRKFGRTRMCQRPGLSKLTDEPLPSGVNGLAAFQSEASVYSVGQTVFTDSFNQASGTTPGDLGDRSPPDGADYKMYVGSAQSLSGPVGGGLPQWSNGPGALPPNPQQSAFFGRSVAVDNDGLTLVVGEPRHVSGDYQGRVLIYRRQAVGHQWGEPVQVLTLANASAPNEPQTSAEFGFSVAIDNGYIVVGSPRWRSDTNNNPGRADAFRPTGDGQWVHHRRWRGGSELPLGGGGPDIGRCVAVSGDLVLIGAPNGLANGTSGAASGVVYSCRLSGSLVEHVKADVLGAPQAGWRFGQSVSLRGGYAVVGAPSAFSGGRAAAYRVLVDNGLFLETVLTHADVGTGDLFGYCVSIDGTTCIVGSPGEDPGGVFNGGAAYVFRRTGGSPLWTFEQKLTAASPANGDEAGRSVAARGDLAVVGAPFRDDAGSNNGALLVFSRTGSSWTLSQSVYDPETTGKSSKNFGDSDGQAVIAVVSDSEFYAGSMRDDGSEIDQGAVRGFLALPPEPDGLFISVQDGEGRVVDEHSYTAPDSTPVVFGCLLKASTPDLLPNIALSIRFRTRAVFGNSQGAVGFFLYASESELDASTGLDRSSIICVSKSRGVSNVLVSATLNNVGALSGVVLPTTVQWRASTDYTLSLIVSGSSARLVLSDGQSSSTIAEISDIRRHGQTVGGTNERGFGFMAGSSGQSGDEFFTYVDDFSVSRVVRGGGSRRTAVVASTRGGDLKIILDRVLSPTGGMNAVVPGLDSVCLVLGPQTSTTGGGFVYVLDGRSYRKVNPSLSVVSTWTASAGSLPIGVVDSTARARFGVLWRNRMILYGVAGNSDNVYASRQRNMDDWNVLATPDGTEAWNYTAPFLVSCVHPLDEDRLLIASLTGLHVMFGDIALGGSVEEVSREIGVSGHYAAAQDERGNTYFVSPQKGLYVIPKGGSSPTPVSLGVRDDFFESIPPDALVRTVWMNRQEGLLIVAQSAEPSCLFYDRSTGAFIDDVMKPEHCGGAVAPDNAAPGGGFVLLGGLDGFIRVHDPGAVSDDGEPIHAVFMYPLLLGLMNRVHVGQVEVRLGEPSDECVLSVSSARSARAVASVSPRVSKRLKKGALAGRLQCETAGSAVGIAVSSVNGSAFSVESCRAWVEGGGVFVENETNKG